jgi:hypothetical protein
LLVRTFGIVLAIGVAGLVIGDAALAAPASIPSRARAALLEEARAVAADEGDSHPYEIRAVRTTRLKALRRLDPDATEPSCEASPSCANAPLYVLAMRGRFSCNTCSPPRGVRIGSGSVITLEIEATEPLPRHSGFSFGNRYPDLRALGAPVRLGTPRRSTGPQRSS